MDDKAIDKVLNTLDVDPDQFKSAVQELQPPERFVEIWKLALHPYLQYQELVLPQGSMMLSINVQPFSTDWSNELGEHFVTWKAIDRSLWVWCLVDPEAPPCNRNALLLETGKPVLNTQLASLVGSVHLALPAGPYAVHMFDTGRETLR